MRNVFLSLLACFPLMGYSQSSSDLGNWLIFFGDKKINNNWNWHHEMQYRNYNAIGDLEQLLLRTGIGYNLTENNNNLLFGYAFIHSQNYENGREEKATTDEHRIFQQFITRQSIGRVKALHRYRFEQRWIERAFSLRFRYFLSLNIPLNNKDMVDKTFYLSTYNEIFINSKDIRRRNPKKISKLCICQGISNATFMPCLSSPFCF